MEEKYLLALFVVVVALSFLFTDGGSISGNVVGMECTMNGQEAVTNSYDIGLNAGTYAVCEDYVWTEYKCDDGERAFLGGGDTVRCVRNNVNIRAS